MVTTARTLYDSQTNAKCGVYLLHFGRREGTDIISQHSFRDADQFLKIISRSPVYPIHIAPLYRSRLWYESTSSTSALSWSAYNSNSSQSRSSDFVEAAGINETSVLMDGNTEQIKPFHVSQKGKNIGIFYVNAKGDKKTWHETR
jgi:hypothetical protein